MQYPKLFALLIGLSLTATPGIAIAQTVEQLVQQGNTALTQKQYAEAEGIWRKVIEQMPKDADAYTKLCDALRRVSVTKFSPQIYGHV
jgi:superkiller protein 3